MTWTCSKPQFNSTQTNPWSRGRCTTRGSHHQPQGCYHICPPGSGSSPELPFCRERSQRNAILQLIACSAWSGSVNMLWTYPNMLKHDWTWKYVFWTCCCIIIIKKHWTRSYMLWTARDMPSTCYCPLALPFEKVGPRGSSMFSVFGMVESMFSMFRHVQHVLFMFFVWKEVVHAKNMHFTWFEHVLNMLNMLNMKNCNWTWQKKKTLFYSWLHVQHDQAL